MKTTISLAAVLVLILANQAMARFSSVDLNSTNLQQHGFSVNITNVHGTIHFNLEFKPALLQRQMSDLDLRARLLLKAKGSLVADVMLSAIRRKDSLLYHFLFSEDLVSESVLSVIVAPNVADHMATTYKFKLIDLISKKNVSELTPADDALKAASEE